MNIDPGLQISSVAINEAGQIIIGGNTPSVPLAYTVDFSTINPRAIAVADLPSYGEIRSVAISTFIGPTNRSWLLQNSINYPIVMIGGDGSL